MFLAEKDVVTFSLVSGTEKITLDPMRNSGKLEYINHLGKYYTPVHSKYNVD